MELTNRVKNTSSNKMEIVIVTRETVTIEPGEEIEFAGDIELE